MMFNIDNFIVCHKDFFVDVFQGQWDLMVATGRTGGGAESGPA